MWLNKVLLEISLRQAVGRCYVSDLGVDKGGTEVKIPIPLRSLPSAGHLVHRPWTDAQMSSEVAQIVSGDRRVP